MRAVWPTPAGGMSPRGRPPVLSRPQSRRCRSVSGNLLARARALGKAGVGPIHASSAGLRFRRTRRSTEAPLGGANGFVDFLHGAQESCSSAEWTVRLGTPCRWDCPAPKEDASQIILAFRGCPLGRPHGVIGMVGGVSGCGTPTPLDNKVWAVQHPRAGGPTRRLSSAATLADYGCAEPMGGTIPPTLVEGEEGGSPSPALGPGVARVRSSPRQRRSARARVCAARCHERPRSGRR